MSNLETNLYWEFGKFTSRDGESLESYYSRFYKMMNELVRNQCHVTNHQVNVQFLLQLQRMAWFVTLKSTTPTNKQLRTSSKPQSSNQGIFSKIKQMELNRPRDLLASLIEKLKCEIDDSKNRNKFLESSNKALVDKLKGEIKDFKTKNRSLESSNNPFSKKQSMKLSKIIQLMFKILRVPSRIDKNNDVHLCVKVEIDCAIAKGDLTVIQN
ncbi:hypothetical protein Tco_0899372 [Tanacetum coccineum]